MCNCSCGSEEKKNALLPQVGIITDIRRETPDVKTFRIVRPDGTKLFEHMPGQCAMLCVPGCRRGTVFHYLFPDKQRVPGVLHQGVRYFNELSSQYVRRR